jgi:hypothetical protein
MPYYVSVDPGIVNVGKCIFDKNWQLVSWNPCSLKVYGDCKDLEEMYCAIKVFWNQELSQWLACGEHHLIIEKQGEDLPTHYFPPLLAAVALAQNGFIKIHLVDPRSVSKWMKTPGKTRDQKKKAYREYANRMLLDAQMPEEWKIRDYDCADAAVNGIYAFCRMFSNPKLKKPDAPLSVRTHQLPSHPVDTDMRKPDGDQEPQAHPVFVPGAYQHEHLMVLDPKPDNNTSPGKLCQWGQ